MVIVLRSGLVVNRKKKKIKRKLKIKFLKMLKHPEAPDRKFGQHVQRKGTILAKERNLFFFSSDRLVENTNIFLAAGGGPCVRFMWHTG